MLCRSSILALALAACSTDTFTGGDAGDDAASDAADATTVDGAKGDASNPRACGPSKVCLESEYCQISSGTVALDGSLAGNYSCNMLPNGCEPTPTCSCMPNQVNCMCADGPMLTVTCHF
jgi:hypothetical protein